MFGSEPDLKIVVKNSDFPVTKTHGAKTIKTAYFRAVLRQHINANILERKRAIDKREKGPYISSKFGELWSIND